MYKSYFSYIALLLNEALEGPGGEVTPEWNPNGSVNNIAGITNAAGNVLGMMPHPERACDALIGGEDGAAIFRSMFTGIPAMH